ncbi:MAG TPA: glycosyltransferase family 39 protein, partial [Gammaproteobacteria bacterium]|nr:glycosyltransferase family 39 protein [Gammaproteobacteria bacterium]
MPDTLKLPAKWHLPLLLLIVAVSAYLRFKGLVYQSYWNDELATIVLADPDRNLLDVIYSSLADKSPPLYQSTLWAWFKLFGFTEFTGRSLSAIAGIVAVPAMYCMAREYTDKETALYATIITGLNAYLVFYSQEVRAYSFFFLEAILAMLFLSRLARDSNIINLLFFSFFTICLVTTHYYGLLLYMAMFGFLVFLKSCSNKFYSLPDRCLYINEALTLLFLMPIIPFMIINALDDSVWIKTPRPDFLISYFTDYFGSNLISSLYAILFFIG